MWLAVPYIWIIIVWIRYGDHDAGACLRTMPFLARLYHRYRWLYIGLVDRASSLLLLAASLVGLARSEVLVINYDVCIQWTCLLCVEFLFPNDMRRTYQRSHKGFLVWLDDTYATFAEDIRGSWVRSLDFGWQRRKKPSLNRHLCHLLAWKCWLYPFGQKMHAPPLVDLANINTGKCMPVSDWIEPRNRKIALRIDDNAALFHISLVLAFGVLPWLDALQLP